MDTMKTIATLLTTTVLLAGVTGAIAAPQGSEEAEGYALGWQAGHGFGGAYASTREPGQVRNSTTPATYDFQLDGR
jgi:hypothetical protein